jgi:hypothetical protein
LVIKSWGTIGAVTSCVMGARGIGSGFAEGGKVNVEAVGWRVQRR